MKISVVVPFWNSEQWLDRCLASLKAQGGDFEFIIVDDHSTDSGREIAEKYWRKDKRFILVTNERTKGVSGARNTGIDHASGEWITFLDADDELLPDAYSIFKSVISQDTRANIHQMNHMRYYTAIDKLAMKYANYGGVYGFGNLPQHWFGVWNKLYKREFLTVRFVEGLQYGEDGLFILECLIKDNYLHHAEYGKVAIKHRFDNKKSLSHVKTAEDIYAQIQAYGDLFIRQTDKIIRQDIAQEIANLWGIRMIKAL